MENSKGCRVCGSISGNNYWCDDCIDKSVKRVMLPIPYFACLKPVVKSEDDLQWDLDNLGVYGGYLRMLRES